MWDEEHEYVVVGSGAGGGPVAANLARAGHRVLILEAGGSPETADDYEYAEWRLARVNLDYHVEAAGFLYSVPHALIRELFTREGVGTMLTSPRPQPQGAGS